MQKTFISFLGAALLILFAGGCSPDSSSPNQPANPSTSNTISIANFAFTPSSKTVALHSTVIWSNNDNATHTATSDAGLWNTGDISSGSSKQITFDSVGTFNYHCTHHSSMKASIIVQ
jgi:plastocyanin